MRTLAMRRTATRAIRLVFDPGHWLLGFSAKPSEGLVNLFCGPIRLRFERVEAASPLSAMSAYAGPVVTTAFENEGNRMA